jgi:hypothetical protein
MKKRLYIKPEINKLDLDNKISLLMLSPPSDPPVLGNGKKSPANPEMFPSPFKDRPFD